MAFVQRALTITFTKGGGLTFGGQGGGANTVTLQGAPNQPLWASCKINQAGAYAAAEMELAIYGMTQNLMNQLTTLGMDISLVQQDQIKVEASTDRGSLATVFQGWIVRAAGDYRSAPEVAFRVHANSGLVGNNATAEATSVKGPVNAATLLKNTFLPMLGLAAYEDNGVTTILNSPYFWGSPRKQAYDCAVQAGIWLDDSCGVLSFGPPGSNRQGETVVISPSTGLVSYPTFNNQGIEVETLFNPNIKIVGQVKLESSLLSMLQQQANNNQFVKQKFATVADGVWSVYALDHNLETTPKGAWFSTLQCSAGGGLALRP